MVLEGVRIAGVTPYRIVPRGGEVDLGGGMLAPGFIDVQVNGGGGALLNDGRRGVVPRIAEVASPVRHGRPHADAGDRRARQTKEAIAAMRAARRQFLPCSACILRGRSSTRRKGAHDASFIREMTRADIEMIADADCGAILLTLAPNRVPPAYITELTARGVLVSLGHAEAEFCRGVARGSKQERARSPISSTR